MEPEKSIVDLNTDPQNCSRMVTCVPQFRSDCFCGPEVDFSKSGDYFWEKEAHISITNDYLWEKEVHFLIWNKYSWEKEVPLKSFSDYLWEKEVDFSKSKMYLWEKEVHISMSWWSFCEDGLDISASESSICEKGLDIFMSEDYLAVNRDTFGNVKITSGRKNPIFRFIFSTSGATGTFFGNEKGIRLAGSRSSGLKCLLPVRGSSP